MSVTGGSFTIPEGGVTLLGLGAGDYTLTEAKAPDGYIITVQPITFTIARDGAVTYTNTYGNQSPTVKVAHNNTTYTVQNEPGKPLPNAGGSGTTAATAVGTMLLATGLALLLRRRASDGAA